MYDIFPSIKCFGHCYPVVRMDCFAVEQHAWSDLAGLGNSKIKARFHTSEKSEKRS